MKKQLIATTMLMTAMAANATESSGIKVQHWLNMDGTPAGCTLDVYQGGKGFSLEGVAQDHHLVVNMTDAVGDWDDLLTDREERKIEYALKTTDDPLYMKDVTKHMRHHEERFATVNDALGAFKVCLQGKSHDKKHEHQL